MKLTAEKRENSGKKEKEKEKEKEKHKDKKEKDKDKKEKDKDKKDKKEKEKSKDKHSTSSPAVPPRTMSPSVSSATLTSKERKSLLREGSTGSTGSDGEKKKTFSSRTLKLGRKRSTKSEPMPEPAKLLEIWNQLLVRSNSHEPKSIRRRSFSGGPFLSSRILALPAPHFLLAQHCFDAQKSLLSILAPTLGILNRSGSKYLTQVLVLLLS